ncbi:KxYKxGKxW signal peptide domain-containing protein [Lacticaseibacillus hulanensis]|uniref:KxYKxGKxW signal peptide domain-containing protein n=1 Tax=Lacticaseibacillus hulanensis TaxID=2493111 RepID=UPI000FDC8C2A|nr:KxYKxGKxW signal peptide domain-containing protein [Lacticaseibacillus hulanensis]
MRSRAIDEKSKHMLVKEHYKLYKSGKLWVAAAISALSIGASTVITAPHSVSAADQLTQTFKDGTTISFRTNEKFPIQSSTPRTLAFNIVQPTAVDANGNPVNVTIDNSRFDATRLGMYEVYLTAGTAHATARIYVVANNSTPVIGTDGVGTIPDGSDMTYYWRTAYEADPEKAKPQNPHMVSDSLGVPFFPNDVEQSVPFSHFSNIGSSENEADPFGSLVGGNNTVGFAKEWRDSNDKPIDVRAWVNKVTYADGPHKGETVNVNQPHFEHDPSDPSTPATIHAWVQVGAAGDTMVAMKTYPVVFTDDAPEISSGSNIQVQQNSSPLSVGTLLGVSATDTEDGPLPVKVTSNYNPEKVGTYHVTMTATDKYGVQTVRNETITVTSHDVYSLPFTYVDEDGNQVHVPEQTTATIDAAANITKYDLKGYTPTEEIINESNRNGGIQSIVADFDKQEVRMYASLNGQGKLISTTPFSKYTTGQLLQMGIETATGTVPLTSGTSYSDLANAYDFAMAISDIKFVYKADAPVVADAAPELKATDATGLVGTDASITDLLKASATDKEDGDLTPLIQVVNDGGFNKDKAGTYNVTLGVKDKAGHFVTKNYTITLNGLPEQTETDSIPTLTATNATAKVGTTDSLPTLLSAAATDKEDGNLTSKITVVNDGGFDKDKAGTYTVTLNVVDSKDHSVTGNYTITLTADEDAKPTDETKPGDDTKPTDETKPGDDTKPTDETKPGDDTKPTDETKPSDTTEPAGTTINNFITNIFNGDPTNSQSATTDTPVNNNTTVTTGGSTATNGNPTNTNNITGATGNLTSNDGNPTNTINNAADPSGSLNPDAGNINTNELGNLTLTTGDTTNTVSPVVTTGNTKVTTGDQTNTNSTTGAPVDSTATTGDQTNAANTTGTTGDSTATTGDTTNTASSTGSTDSLPSTTTNTDNTAGTSGKETSPSSYQTNTTNTTGNGGDDNSASSNQTNTTGTTGDDNSSSSNPTNSTNATGTTGNDNSSSSNPTNSTNTTGAAGDDNSSSSNPTNSTNTTGTTGNTTNTTGTLPSTTNTNEPAGNGTASTGNTTNTANTNGPTGNRSTTDDGTIGALPDTGTFTSPSGTNGVISSSSTPLADTFTGVTSSGRTGLPSTFGGSSTSTHSSAIPQTGNRQNNIATAVGVAILAGMMLIGGIRLGRRHEG